jgi:hypothetical protein
MRVKTAADEHDGRARDARRQRSKSKANALEARTPGGSLRTRSISSSAAQMKRPGTRSAPAATQSRSWRSNRVRSSSDVDLSIAGRESASMAPEARLA